MPFIATDVANSTHTRPGTRALLEPHAAAVSEASWELARETHATPELAWQEYEATARLCAHLGRHGFDVTTPYCDLETSFLAQARLNGEGPTVTFLAEYDALPNLGHACGHNLVCSASAGAAIALVAAAREQGLGGTVRVLGTPAEEGGGGKIVLVERNAFADTDVAMMFHPGVRNMPIRGALAATRLTFTFHGRAAHAASNPHLGINALDACRLTYNAIDAMRQHFPDETRVHGIIREGGAAANVVPDHVVAEFSVRHPSVTRLQEVIGQVRRCAEGAALAVGATVTVEQDRTYAERRNNRMLGFRFGGYLQELGRELSDPPAFGGVGSSDIGNVSQVVPTIHPYIAIADPGVSNHTPEFADAATGERARAALDDAIRALAMTGYDVLTDPEYLEAIRQEFAGTDA